MRRELVPISYQNIQTVAVLTTVENEDELQQLFPDNDMRIYVIHVGLINLQYAQTPQILKMFKHAACFPIGIDLLQSVLGYYQAHPELVNNWKQVRRS